MIGMRTRKSTTTSRKRTRKRRMMVRVLLPNDLAAVSRLPPAILVSPRVDASSRIRYLRRQDTSRDTATRFRITVDRDRSERSRGPVLAQWHSNKRLVLLRTGNGTFRRIGRISPRSEKFLQRTARATFSHDLALVPRKKAKAGDKFICQIYSHVLFSIFSYVHVRECVCVSVDFIIVFIKF